MATAKILGTPLSQAGSTVDNELRRTKYDGI